MRVPLVMAVCAILISIITDLYIYLDLRKNFSSRYRWLPISYGISAIACWIFLLVILLLPRREATHSITFIMWAFYSYITLYLPKLIFCLFSILGLTPRIWRGNGLKLGKWIGLPLAVITFFAMWWGAVVTRRSIEVVEVNINSPRLPEGFEGYRIVQISDLHVGTWGEDKSFVSALVDSINSLQPDVIFFTGDIVNRQTRELQPFLTTLSRLKAPDGVWSVLGNHDYGDYIEWNTPEEKEANLNLLKNWQRQIGWTMLNNSSADLTRGGDTIKLIGVENWGEPPFHQYGYLLGSYPDKNNGIGLNDSYYKILLSHNPEHWRREVVDISNIDLTLAGHTHAMQTEIKLGDRKWSPAALRYPLWGGLYIDQNKNGELLQLYVNIGAGEVGMPFRIGAIPEITLITLHRATVPYSLQPSKEK